MIRIRRALFSAYHKEGLVPLANEVARWGGEILASGGTARILEAEGLDVTPIEEITGVGSLFGGRVKTLHPKIHGGILFRREVAADRAEAEREGIQGIDLVVVNLYPFGSALEREASPEETIELIDIGGPAMVRAAAKNHRNVGVVTDPADYERVRVALHVGEGALSEEFCRRLAGQAFAVTAEYDAAIAQYLTEPNGAGRSLGDEPSLPPRWSVHVPLARTLRYGENPSQAGGLYGRGVQFPFDLEQLHGKELSYNNLLDLGCGRDVIAEFGDQLAAVVIKHGIPCGVATGEELAPTYARARSGDALSAFGGVVILNRPIDLPTAELLNESFLEVVLAPEYDEDTLSVLRQKKNRVLLRASAESLHHPGAELRGRFIGNGYLLQTALPPGSGETEWKLVTKREPSQRERADLRFAWRVLKHVRSNGVLFARDGMTLGIGSGQTSRIDAVEIAIAKARREKHSLEGSVMVSDAFFPFSDCVERAAQVGASAVLQPGGSIRDADSVEACDRLGMVMLTNNARVFSHG